MLLVGIDWSQYSYQLRSQLSRQKMFSNYRDDGDFLQRPEPDDVAVPADVFCGQVQQMHLKSRMRQVIGREKIFS